MVRGQCGEDTIAAADERSLSALAPDQRTLNEVLEWQWWQAGTGHHAGGPQATFQGKGPGPSARGQPAQSRLSGPRSKILPAVNKTKNK